MSFAAGQIVYEDDLDDLQPIIKAKGGSTSRVNNTISADPDLSAITLEPGTYSIEVALFFTVATNVPSIKTRWAFSGSWSSPMRLCHGPGTTNVAESNAVTPSTFRGYDATTQDAIYNKVNSSAYGAILEKADSVVITATGDFSVQWAQSVTTAVNVTVQPNSTVKITKIAA